MTIFSSPFGAGRVSVGHHIKSDDNLVFEWKLMLSVPPSDCLPVCLFLFCSILFVFFGGEGRGRKGREGEMVVGRGGGGHWSG